MASVTSVNGGLSPCGESAKVTDKSLLRLFREGKADAATNLYHRYACRLMAFARSQLSSNLARRMEPEDLIQSVFAVFFQEARKGNYVVPANGDLWQLLLVIALNKIRTRGSYHHAAKRDSRVTIDFDFFSAADSIPPEEDEGKIAFLQLAIREAFEHLPPQHRSVMKLRMEGYEVAEISRLTERSKRTVERILQESREILSRLLEDGK